MQQQATAVHGYWARDADFESERTRLQLLESRYDPITTQRLDRLGVGEGFRCLEVGAGAGSIAHWLAGRVGASGRVVAADIDPRFLQQLDLPNVEVRRLDILNDPVEEDTYDLVHCRALLLHLPDPRRALERMVSSIRPGGWLLAEDVDYGTLTPADPEHRLSAAWERAAQSFLRILKSSGALDLHLGLRLPDLMKGLDITDLDYEGHVQVQRGGGRMCEFMRLSMNSFLDHFPERDLVDDADLVVVWNAISDPSFSFVDATSCAARGRRCHDGQSSTHD